MFIQGAVEFLKQEYLICLIFVAVMFIVITFLTSEGVMTAIAFAIGAVISIVCGALGMVVATQTNFRTTYCARIGLAPAFRVAFRAGCAMGFALVSIGLLGN
jgi:K(+)-stimulated pyrophosphate-energized sodium pump